jgi:hypothetical protein
VNASGQRKRNWQSDWESIARYEGGVIPMPKAVEMALKLGEAEEKK